VTTNGDEQKVGTQLEETTAGGRKINNEVSCNLSCSLNAITVNKSRKKRWVENVARNGQMSENLNGRSHFRDIGENGSIILKWIVKKQDDSVVQFHLTQGRDQWWAHMGTTVNNIHWYESSSFRYIICCLFSYTTRLHFFHIPCSYLYYS
jgi:hypothetical protein